MVCFSTGLMLDGAVALIGLTAMSCVPDHLASTAHGFTCAFSQGTYYTYIQYRRSIVYMYICTCTQCSLYTCTCSEFGKLLC